MGRLGKGMGNLLCGQRGLIFREVDPPPLASFYSFANLSAATPFASLLVRVKALADADLATRGVFAREAVQQAAVALAAITVAVARLLIEHFLDPRREDVGVLYHGAREKCRTHRRRQRTLRNFGVECRNRLFGSAL